MPYRSSKKYEDNSGFDICGDCGEFAENCICPDDECCYCGEIEDDCDCCDEEGYPEYDDNEDSCCSKIDCVHNNEVVAPPLNAFARARWLKEQGRIE